MDIRRVTCDKTQDILSLLHIKSELHPHLHPCECELASHNVMFLSLCPLRLNSFLYNVCHIQTILLCDMEFGYKTPIEGLDDTIRFPIPPEKCLFQSVYALRFKSMFICFV